MLHGVSKAGEFEGMGVFLKFKQGFIIVVRQCVKRNLSVRGRAKFQFNGAGGGAGKKNEGPEQLGVDSKRGRCRDFVNREEASRWVGVASC